MATYYKGYGPGMICRGKKYEEGHVYEEERAEVCECGMHFCKNPFDVLDYYDIVNEDGEFNEFSTVEPLDESLTDDGKKFCTRKLKIGAKLSISGFIKACVDFVIEKTTEESGTDTASARDAKIGSSGKYAKIGSSGYYAKIGSSGDCAQIGSSGDYAQIGSSGNSAKIGSSGYYAQIGSSGYYAQIGSSGDYAKIGSSGNYAKIGSSGDYAKIGSSGYYAQIGSSGDYAKIGSSGYCAVVMCAGRCSKVKAKKGSFITLAEWKQRDDGRWIPAHVVTKQVDGEEIKENTFYMLKDGEFVEVEDE